MSRFSTIDLASLPAMAILEQIDAEAIIATRMQRLVERWALHDPPNGAQYDVQNLEFDPIKINQEANAYGEVLLRDRVNQAARAVTLAYASGTDLDAIASRYPGGVPRLAGEPYTLTGDARYRRRIWLSVSPLSPHGTAESYQFWALSALEGFLRDASTIKIRPSLQDNPTIVVTCLAAGEDPKPTRAQLLEIRRYIMDESREGFTDVISVNAPKVKEINYLIDVWLYPGPDANAVLALMTEKLQQLVTEQYWLGFDHTQSAIEAACKITGVHNVIVREPETDIFVPPDWVVVVKSIKVHFRGRAE
jgi:phage-related baseplate assembly protein